MGKPLRLVHEPDVMELMYEDRDKVIDPHSFEARRRLRERLGRRHALLRDYVRFMAQETECTPSA